MNRFRLITSNLSFFYPKRYIYIVFKLRVYMNSETEDLLVEIKEKGWETLIRECEDDIICADLSPFADLAENWGCCAVGEILGFPADDEAWNVVKDLPRELHNLGTDFSEAIYQNDHESAMDALTQIKEQASMILEAKQKILG